MPMDSFCNFKYFSGNLSISATIAKNAALKPRIIHPGRRHPYEALLEGMEHQLAFMVQVEFAHDRLAVGADRLR